MKQAKRTLSLLLSVLMIFSMLMGTWAVSAEESDEYQIFNDGYGNLTANFPSVYPEEYIIIESDTIIEQKIEAIMETLTYDEKVSMLAGATASHRTYGTGFWGGCARLGIPVMRFYDGPMGVRGNPGEETTRPPNEVALTAMFDTDAAYQSGLLVGAENKANGGNMQLGDQVDLVRQLTLSRARDMFGEDWYLGGQIAAAVTKGMQDENVIACLKHLGGMGNIDEQTMHESYLSMVEIPLKKGNAGSVMTNYLTTNGITACAGDYLLKDVLRSMWGYDGIILTDWGGNYSFTTDNGVTIETPRAQHNTPAAIAAALANGTITMADIDEAIIYNLTALGKAGWLGLVQISRDGTVAADSTPPAYIELPDIATGDARRALLDKNHQTAIELAQKGAVLLKNEGNALPLKSNEKTALIGFGATNLIAGHQHECSFGALEGLSVSPYDALSQMMSNVTAYTAQDITKIGNPVPASVLYQDEEASRPGVTYTGTDGNGEASTGESADINFVTDSTDYKNSATGTAFPSGTTGPNYTFTTYLKAPATGSYIFKIQAIGATTINGNITIDGAAKTIPAAGGNKGVGDFGSSSIVCTDTGLDVPAANTAYTLEEGKVYKIVVNANGNYASQYAFQQGVKDMQVRLAWTMPTEEETMYTNAMTAAGTPGTTVVLFAHNLENSNTLTFDATQQKLLDDAVAAAKAAGNKILLVTSTSLPVDITKWVDDCDAVLQMWLPGQGGGTALANILTGRYNPTGKLPVAWPKNASMDQREIITTGRALATGQTAGGPGGGTSNTEVKEGLFHGYKWYDAAGKQDDILFDFGHGLSYTDFTYELVGIESGTQGVDDYGYDFNIKVTNSGNVPGANAPQLYIGAARQLQNGVYSPYDVADSWRYVYPEGKTHYNDAEYFPLIDGVQQVKYQLVGFDMTRVLNPGDSETITIHVDQRALSYWDVSLEDYYVRADGTQDKWTVLEGERDFFIGNSSDDFVIEEQIDVKAADKSGITLTHPGQANVNETFTVTITTPSDVIGLALYNENGKAIGIQSMTRVKGEGKTTWTLTTAIGTKGVGREISLFVKTLEKGLYDSGKRIVIDIVKPDAAVLSASFAANEVVVNQVVAVKVVTNAFATKLLVTNELDRKMGVGVTSKTTNADGSITWNCTMSFGTKGYGKIYTFAGVGSDGVTGQKVAKDYVDVL